MRVGTVLRTIGKHANIHVCLVVIFALSWFLHYMASMRMEMCNGQFRVMNDQTMRTMALIDFIAANFWLAIVYAFLVFAAVVFLQIRARPPWIWWLTAVAFCAPCIVYWSACAYIAVGKLL
jgi:hypothetical protein